MTEMEVAGLDEAMDSPPYSAEWKLEWCLCGSEIGSQMMVDTVCISDLITWRCHRYEH